MSHQIGDRPIEDGLRETMVNIMRGLDEIFNQGLSGDEKNVGIVMLLFPYGANDGRCNYISNGARREDIVTLFKEQIARFEGMPEVKSDARH